MTGTYQPRGRVYARHGIDDEVLAPGILTEGLIGRPGIPSYFGPFDATIKEETASPERVFALDFDADPLFMKQRRARFSGVDLGTDPDTGDAMAPGALSSAPMARPAPPYGQQASNDDTRQEAVVLGPIIVREDDAEEPVFTEESGAGLSSAKFDDGSMPGTVPGTAERLGPGVLTAPSRSTDAPDQGSADDAGTQKPAWPNLLTISTPGTAPDSGRMRPGALTAPSQSGKISYRGPAGSADGLNAGPPNEPPAARKSTYGRAGLAESFIPFWGAGRDLYADIEERDYLGAAMNGGLLLADAFTFAVPPANMALKAAVKGAKAGGLMGGLKGAAEGITYAMRGPILREYPSHAEWPHVRKTMGKHGWFEWGQQGHHWIFPQRWDWVPAWIRNHPLNIKAMKIPEHNYRIEGAYDGKPKYKLPMILWHGMPGWSKVLAGEIAIGRPFKAGYYFGSGHYGSEKNDRPTPAVSGPGAGPGTGTQ